MIVGAGWSILDNFTPDLSSCKPGSTSNFGMRRRLVFSIRLVSRSFYVSNSTSAKRVWSWHCEAGEYFSGSRCPGWKAAGSEAPSTDTKDFLIWWIHTLHMTHMTSLAKLDHSLFALLSKCTSWWFVECHKVFNVQCNRIMLSFKLSQKLFKYLKAN